MNLHGKIAVLTGATGGIGTALIEALTAKGVEVITIGNNPGKPAIYHANLVNPKERTKLAKQILQTHPHIDILINNAGIGYYDNFDQINQKEWYESYELNVHAPLFFTQELLPGLSRSAQSVVVNVGSLAGINAKPGRATYNSTKFALRGLTLCLAEEYQNKNPQFIHLALDSVLTPFGPWSTKQKEAKQQAGKKYLSSASVSQQIIQILESEAWQPEYLITSAS